MKKKENKKTRQVVKSIQFNVTMYGDIKDDEAREIAGQIQEKWPSAFINFSYKRKYISL